MHYLLAYDIRDPKRLVKVAKVMENYGVRVQKSIFEAVLDPGAIQRLRLELVQVLDLTDDGVKLFPLCERCRQRISVFGQDEPTDLFEALVVI